MDGVHLELDGSEYPDEGEGSLARFTALRSLTLRQKDFDGLLWDELHLPSGLRYARGYSANTVLLLQT